MTEKERQEILVKAKIFFRDRIAAKHHDNTEKLKDINAFNVNPFLHNYLAKFVFGETTPEALAKALLYPRVMSTSITTTFGTQLQFFCNEVLSSFASTTSGIDIEFVDAIDGRKKYCQTKAGPQTINNDDVQTIKNHFIAIKNIAKTNRMMDFNPMYDCVVGVFYGTEASLGPAYKKIAKDYPVFVGNDFWHRLTGDEAFYQELIQAFAEVADEIDGRQLMDEVIESLKKQLEEQL